MAKMNKKIETTEHETDIDGNVAGPIDNHNDFNDALLEKQANIDVEPNPYLEVSHKFFAALSKGRTISSLMYGDPGVRVYPHGAKKEIDLLEKMPAEKLREMEIRKISEAANK